MSAQRYTYQGVRNFGVADSWSLGRNRATTRTPAACQFGRGLPCAFPMSTSVSQILHQGAQRHPARTACTALDAAGRHAEHHTYAELDQRAQRIADDLKGRGIGPGDAVALCIGTGIDFIYTYFGVLYVGATAVPLPILSAPPEIEYRVKHAQCRALLFDRGRSELINSTQLGSTVAVALEQIAEAGPRTTPCARDAADTAMLLYTSGTTGAAKGAAISHGALLTHTAVLAYHALQLTPEDRILGILPLTHSYGCRMVMLASFYAGAACVLLPRFDPAVAMEVMVRDKISWLPAVPTMFTAMANLPESTPVPALRWAMCAGAPLPDDTARRAEARLGCEVRQGFGMTEATIATLNSPPDARVLGSVGKAVWGVELHIKRADGELAEPGEHGELWIRGHNTMSQYLLDPAATAEAKRDGFIRSGDLGYLDPSGRLFIVDRIKDLIIRGGNNVYPSEVENALAEHAAIRAVAVVGRRDDYYGEEIVAVIERKAGVPLTASEVAQWARARVARTKVPREVVFVESLPLGPSGKILKRSLRLDIENGTLPTERSA